MEPFEAIAQQVNGTKRVNVKFVGGMKPPQTLQLLPGTTAADVLKNLGLDASYEVSDAASLTVFRADEVLFPRIEDGSMLHVASMVDAGAAA